MSSSMSGHRGLAVVFTPTLFMPSSYKRNPAGGGASINESPEIRGGDYVGTLAGWCCRDGTTERDVYVEDVALLQFVYCKVRLAGVR